MITTEMLESAGCENTDTVESCLGRALAAHKSDITRYEIARHFLITIASQKLPSELEDESDGDFQGAYETIVMMAREAVTEIKATRIKAKKGNE